MARVMGTLTDNEFITQLTMQLKGQREMDINPLGPISKLSHSQRVTARDWMGRSLLRKL